MKLTGKKMSPQARRALNNVVLEWLNQNATKIAESCLVGEVFRSQASEALLWRTKLQRHLVESLRVRNGDSPATCTVSQLSSNGTEFPQWKRLSTTMLGAALGMDHTNFVKRKGKAKS